MAVADARGTRARLLNAAATAGLLVASLVVAVLIAEGVLRLAVDPADFLHAKLAKDPVLGHRIEPHTTGHDAFGFRNRTVPERARVVAIGDSNTYGVSATREGSWPQQLGVELGEPVYNMGLGGYGPLQYLHLARTTARSLQPDWIVVGLYFGNDLMDAHLVAHAREVWRNWRLADTPSSGAEAPAPVVEEPARRFGALRHWLARHSMVYGVLRVTVLQPMAAAEREAEVRQASPDSRWSWSDPAPDAAVRTVFTPQTRLAAVDTNLPAVREGLDITKNVLLALKEEAERQRARLLVVTIPTKERAYCSYLRASGAALPPTFARLCEAEPVAQAEISTFLGEHGIAVLDATPALESQIARHVPLYPPDADGHAQASGYGVIAQAVAGALRAAEGAR